jgi:predicted Zn-dependent protease
MIEARYFDGQTAKAHAVRIGIQGEELVIASVQGNLTEVIRRQPLTRIWVQERTRLAAQRIDLGGGAVLEVTDAAALEAMLAKAGITPGKVQGLQRSWRWVVASLAAVVLAAWVGFTVLIPALANTAAHALPPSAEQALGDQAWQSMQGDSFGSSRLPADRQESLKARFAAMARVVAPEVRYELVFAQSRVGPNAFALPGGRIILTDELVLLANDDDAVLGVLAHELGHVAERHSVRNIAQSLAVGAAISLWLGDMSSLAVAVPTAVLSMKHSRDFERDADRFAVRTLKASGMSTEPLARLLEKLTGPADGPLAPFLATHPLTEERVRLLREGR